MELGVLYLRKKGSLLLWQSDVLLGSAGLFLLLCFMLQCLGPSLAGAQSADAEKPVPILSGSAGYFNFVTAGQNQVDAQINPVLLVPLGERWLVEARAEFEGAS